MTEEVKLGVKEIEEAIDGVMEVALFLVERLKDGVDLGDATAAYAKFVKDDEFKALLIKAYEGYDKIPAEAKDIDFEEGLSLAMKVGMYVPKFIENFKKQ